MPTTALVEIMNVALSDPAGTVTLAGTVIGSTLAANGTTAPPAGAAAVRIAVPFTLFPPTTLDVLSKIFESATVGAVTVSVGD